MQAWRLSFSGVAFAGRRMPEVQRLSESEFVKILVNYQIRL